MNLAGTVLSVGDEGWSLELSKTWNVLGPFPLHAREQHFLSPSFPIDTSEPIDFGKSWPSSYVDGGEASWITTSMEQDGNLKISFPDVRWRALRATEGWAALQYHSVLCTTFSIHPPPTNEIPPSKIRLSVHLKQGSFFAILSDQSSDRFHPRWHAGDIYAMDHILPKIVDLPLTPSASSPTKYQLFISGDYEIRLFGDPRSYGSEVPLLTMNIQLAVDVANENVLWEQNQDVLPDFVDGFAFGNAMGICLRSVSGWWVVRGVSLECPSEVITLTLLSNFRIAPTQARLIPIKISQTRPFKDRELRVKLSVVSSASSVTILAVIPVKHHPMWSPLQCTPIQASYFYAQFNPTPFLVLPPKEPNLDSHDSAAPLLALHGAGVDILRHSFWADSLPRQNHSWIIMPTGRTPWGLDWHGPSADDAWASLDGLISILEKDAVWEAWSPKKDTRVIVLGHSNGGQGACYLASRFPDRVLGVISAAGYIKSQAYVPWTMSRFAHFVDPSLRTILETSLTPDDNDLFLSNLVDTPVLAVHGGEDDNVPVWHSRESVSILRTWKPHALVQYHEAEGQPHWFPQVFRTEVVRSFLDSLQRLESSSEYTLTVSIPIESGSLHGWRIEAIKVPGRLGRLHVMENDGNFRVKTVNVQIFSFSGFRIHELVVDGFSVPLPNDSGIIRLRKTSAGTWQLDTESPFFIQPTGRFQLILSSTSLLLLVIASFAPSQDLSIALRIAHDLHNYHRIDTEIISSAEAFGRVAGGQLGDGNIIIVGGVHLPFARWILSMSQGRATFRIEEDRFKLNGKTFVGDDQGMLFLHPHPVSPSGLVAFVSGTDHLGIERAARLFPIRASVVLPDWLVIGGGADKVGAAATVGAGVWGTEWGPNECVSWLE